MLNNKQKSPYGVMLILGLFSLLFCVVYCREKSFVKES